MSQEGSFNASRGIRWSWIIAGLVVALLCAVFALRALDGAFTYYLTTDEYLMRKESLEGKRLKIAGFVQKGSLQKNGDDYRFQVEFQGSSFPVHYQGFAPDTFKEGVEVVVEGREEGQEVFKAETLMAKCASKYEAGGLPPLEEQISDR